MDPKLKEKYYELRRLAINQGANFSGNNMCSIAILEGNAEGGANRIISRPFFPGEGGPVRGWVPHCGADRPNDAEPKALTDLEIKCEKARRRIQASDTVYILSNFGPCPSCRKVIKHFAKHYEVTIHNFYVKHEKHQLTARSKAVLYGWGDKPEQDGNLYHKQV